jgi:hypothetical protein
MQGELADKRKLLPARLKNWGALMMFLVPELGLGIVQQYAKSGAGSPA